MLLCCRLKRAGLDYWPYVCVAVHDDWAAFHDFFREQGRGRLIAFSKFGQKPHTAPGTYQPGAESVITNRCQHCCNESIHPGKEHMPPLMKAASCTAAGDWLLFGAETSGLPVEVTAGGVVMHGVVVMHDLSAP